MLACQLAGKDPCHLVDRGLGCRVGVGLQSRDVDAVDRADVDHASRVVLVAGRFELRYEEAREVEHAFHVEVEDPVPRGVVEVRHRRPPRRTGVVDEDVQRRLTLGERVGEATALGLGGEVSRQRHAGADLGELGGDLLAHRRLARRDVDPGAGLDHPPGDHQADATTAAGDERGLPLDREQIVDGHGGSPSARAM